MEKLCYNASMFNEKPKGFTMSDNVKFVIGLVYIAVMVALGLVLIASYFDVLVK